MTTTPAAFVPAGLDATRWDSLEPLYAALLDRPVESLRDLERWLVDRSELDAAASEAEANLYITMTCNTEDAGAAQAYTTYIQTVPPMLKPRAFELDKRQTVLAARFPLDTARYAVLSRDVAAEVELFREENVPIQTELELLSQRYQTIVGAMTVRFQDQERTLPQMGVFQESTDRAVREAAWRTVADRRLQDRDAIDALFDEMIALRHRMARNAGFDSFIVYAFRARRRFDYSPRDCEAFHRACEAFVVPFARRRQGARRDALGVDPLRPWDLAVDTRGRPPLRPFSGGVDLVARARAVLHATDPRLEAMFGTLGDGSNTRGAATGASLDLDSRKGKAPGGYQYMRDRSRRPFIFMNAAGLHRDVETMVHEAGHAFHSMLCADEPLLHYRHSPIEFAEVASMSMELLSMAHWGAPEAFYPNPEDLARAQRQHLESSLSLLPWIATIDAFQHWIYLHPTHSREQRLDAWVELDERFGPAVSWDSLEDHRQWVWHRQPHLFAHPLYYIEYGIAQLGALQLWLVSKEQGPAAAIDAYLRALRLGGSKPLPELFAAAGLRFDFGPETIARLVDRVEIELDKLPE